MPNAEIRSADAAGWVRHATLIVLAVTAFRVALLAVNQTDLFVDESQYWLWGQELALGYYSKPPLIGWVIRAATELSGSDSAFWIRLPAPLFHAVTALLLAAIAAPRFGNAAATAVAATYVTMPMVTVGSLMISTDTIMVPFLALALMCWLRGLDRGGSVLWAAAAGTILGLAFLAKYAAIYYAICAALAALLMWQARPGWKPALAGLTAFLLAISPNIIWNLLNGLSTLEHTLDNADWVRDPGRRAALQPASLAGFFGSQFAVFGPVFFAALVWLAVTFRQRTADQKFLLVFSVPIIAVVSVQALLSEAYANWAAAAYLAAALLVAPWLAARHRGWFRAGLGLNVAIALLLPLATVIGTGWRVGPDGNLLLERYVGRVAMSREILAAAERFDMDTVVVNDRDVIADLFHTARDSGVTFYARPRSGRAPDHYVLKYALPPQIEGKVLLVTRHDSARASCDAERVGVIAPENGAYADRSQKLYIVEARCLAPRDSRS